MHVFARATLQDRRIAGTARHGEGTAEPGKPCVGTTVKVVGMVTISCLEFIGSQALRDL
jgi:hypothetical protein